MNSLLNTLFDAKVLQIYQLLQVLQEEGPASSTASEKINSLCQDCFETLRKEAQEIEGKSRRQEYALFSIQGDDLSSFQTHFHAMKTIFEAHNTLLEPIYSEGKSTVNQISQQFDGLLDNMVERTEILRKEPENAKRSLRPLFHVLGELKKQEERERAVALLSKCHSPQEIKGLTSVARICPEQLSFLAKLPDSLIRQLLSSIKGNEQKLAFLSSLAFPYQVYFITHLNWNYEWGIQCYNQNPTLLETAMNLEAAAPKRKRVQEWLGNSPRVIQFFHERPELLQICLKLSNKNSSIEDKSKTEGQLLDNLLAGGKGDWIEKLLLLFDKNRFALGDILQFLDENQKYQTPLDPAILFFLNQDTALVRTYHESLFCLAKILFSPLIKWGIKSWGDSLKVSQDVKELIEKLFAYTTEENLPVFEKLTSILTEQKVKQTLTLLKDLEKHPEALPNLSNLLEMGGLDFASLITRHQISSERGVSSLQIFNQLLQKYPKEVQECLAQILGFWNRPVEPLNKEELSFLCSLLFISEKNRTLFQSIASLALQFPLPEGAKLLKLEQLSEGGLRSFENYLREIPECGWWLLQYVHTNLFFAKDLLILKPTDAAVASCFRVRDPLRALDKLVREKFYPAIGVKGSSTSFTLFDLPISETPHFTKTSQLLQTSSSELLPYLRSLSVLEMQQKNSSLVAGLLSLYPESYPSLVQLALEGYSREAMSLLKRIQQEKPLSSFTEQLLQLATQAKGRWLAAALKVEAQKSEPLIGKVWEQILQAQEITPLVEEITFLAAAEERELLAAVQENMGPSPLIDWVSQGNLSFAGWVVHQDKTNQDRLYRELRNVASASLQEGFLQLYRSLPEQLRGSIFQWVLKQENQTESLRQLFYLQVHDPASLPKRISNLNQMISPLTQLNAKTKIGAEEKLSSEDRALKEQFQFAVAAADLLVNANGSLNRGMLATLRQSDFIVRNRNAKTTVYHYLDWVFQLLESNGEFSERLSTGATIPPQGSPAMALIRKTLSKSSSEPLMLRDVQVALLSCLLQRPWQSESVGSCFGTAVVILSHSSESFLLQTLDDYLELTGSNSLTRGNVQFPLALRSEVGSIEHPLVKAREYCISSMASPESTDTVRSRNIVKLFDKEEGVIPALLSRIGRKDPKAYQEMIVLQQTLKSSFLTKTCELFDPLLKKEKESTLGGWVLADRTSYQLINSQELYESLLLKLTDLPQSNFSSSMQEGIMLLNEKISNHELVDFLKPRMGEHPPWGERKGGWMEEIIPRYFNYPCPAPVRFSEVKARDELKMIYIQTKALHPATNEGIQNKILCQSVGHQFTLLPYRMLSLQKFKDFEEIEAFLKPATQAFSTLLINSELAEKWVGALCSTLSRKNEAALRFYLTQYPLPQLPLQAFGWRLTDALQRILATQDDKKRKIVPTYVEAAALNLEELKEKRPPYIVVGDYNWTTENDACYIAYGFNSFTGEMETYSVGEEGRELVPKYNLSGMTIQGKIPEPTWKPVKKNI